jgi:hypothetical protein
MILAPPKYTHVEPDTLEYIGENSLLIISYRNVVKLCVFVIILATIIHIVLGDKSTMNNTYYAIGYCMSVGMFALLYFVLLRGEHADRINDYHNAKNPSVIRKRPDRNANILAETVKPQERSIDDRSKVSEGDSGRTADVQAAAADDENLH